MHVAVHMSYMSCLLWSSQFAFNKVMQKEAMEPPKPKEPPPPIAH